MRSRFSALSSTTSTRAISAGRQRDGERAAVAELAAHGDGAAEDLGQLLADVEAEPGAFELASLGRADLLEGSEEALLVVRGDPDTRVGHAELDRPASVGRAQPQCHATRVGELDGVVGQVDEDLGQSPAVRLNADLLAGCVDQELEAVAFAQWSE